MSTLQHPRYRARLRKSYRGTLCVAGLGALLIAASSGAIKLVNIMAEPSPVPTADCSDVASTLDQYGIDGWAMCVLMRIAEEYGQSGYSTVNGTPPITRDATVDMLMNSSLMSTGGLTTESSAFMIYGEFHVGDWVFDQATGKFKKASKP